MATTSIIVPVYCKTAQELEWFDACIDSASHQDDDVQIVVWDDASPVDVRSVISKYGIDKYGRGDTRVGPARARNLAVQMASGPFIFPLDADDVLVTGTVARLQQMWDGKPIYTDIYKFGNVDVPHYRLMDWCPHLFDKISIAVVNVYHTLEQWYGVGGWNDSINLYEDGEYNARLFLRYCAVHVPEPLIGYRVHTGQRTASILPTKHAVRSVLNMVHNFAERIGEMGCCDRPRRTLGNIPKPATKTVSKTAQSSNRQSTPTLPGSGGDTVLAEYIGGAGMGKHYYRGLVTKYAYKVKQGQVLSVDPRDCDATNSLFRRISAPTPTPAQSIQLASPQPVQQEIVQLSPDMVVRTPNVSPVRRSV